MGCLFKSLCLLLGYSCLHAVCLCVFVFASFIFECTLVFYMMSVCFCLPFARTLGSACCVYILLHACVLYHYMCALLPFISSEGCRGNCTAVVIWGLKLERWGGDLHLTTYSYYISLKVEKRIHQL